jgi:dihydrofolate synthase / folylpolyglutamate synthase
MLRTLLSPINRLSRRLVKPLNGPVNPVVRFQSSTSRSVSTMDQESDSNVQQSTSSTRKYTDYETWVRRLYSTNLFHPVKLGLTNMIKLYEALGRPMDQTCVVHIAGTNGKGSVAWKIARSLQHRPNARIGLFTSPHISCFRERMQVNGALITEDEVVRLLPPIYEICQQLDIPATFFEITTALAFSYYASQKVDVVVLETGLGGRLDATNILSCPALAIITSIGLEHTRILGDTIELIAQEKGGIIKPSRPVLVGPNVPLDVLQNCARKKGASAFYTCEDILGPDASSATDDYDLENAQIARAAIYLLQQSHPELATLSEDAVRQGTSERPPCRFELFYHPTMNVPIILDVAHNPPAIEYLLYKLRTTYPRARFRVVVGMSSDKDLRLVALVLKRLVNGDICRIHLVQAAHPRAAKLEQIWAADPDLQRAHYDVSDRSVTRQLSLAVEMVTTREPETTALNTFSMSNHEIVVVCGSVFLMAETREAMHLDEPRDSPYIAELAGAGVRHGQENFGNSTVTSLP